MKAIKIKPGACVDISEVEITGMNISEQNDCIYKQLGGYFDIVRLGSDACMLVDDEGILKGLQPNMVAMMISGYPVIVGPALIVGARKILTGDEEFRDVPERFVKFARDMNKAADCVGLDEPEEK